MAGVFRFILVAEQPMKTFKFGIYMNSGAFSSVLYMLKHNPVHTLSVPQYLGKDPVLPKPNLRETKEAETLVGLETS